MLLQGIHPWMGGDKHYSLPDAFLRCLNDDAAKVSGLLPFNPVLGMCWRLSTIPTATGYDHERRTKFERTLETLRKDVVFVDDLTYPELLEIAKERLRTRWNHALALTLLTHVHSSFPEQRRFLKSKDKSIKLSGRAGLDNYDLGPRAQPRGLRAAGCPDRLRGHPDAQFSGSRAAWTRSRTGRAACGSSPRYTGLSVSTLTPGQGEKHVRRACLLGGGAAGPDPAFPARARR